MTPPSQNPQPQPQLISASSAEKLEAHAKFIRLCIAGQRKGSAEIFGYAFLAGHRMLLAKADVPHGNSGDRSLGLKSWAEANLKEVPYRTLTRWMEFADGVHEHFATLGKAGSDLKQKRIPLLLNRNKINAADRPLILKAVLQVMDGKSMLAFMRDSRLLRDPERAVHHPKKALDPEKELQAVKKRAVRHWKTCVADLALGFPAIKHLPLDQLNHASFAALQAANHLAKELPPKEQSEYLGYLVASANVIRTKQKLK